MNAELKTINMKSKIYFIQFDYSNLYMFYALNYDEQYYNKYYREELSCDAESYQKDEMKPMFSGSKNNNKLEQLVPDLFTEYNFQQFYEECEKLTIWDMSI